MNVLAIYVANEHQRAQMEASIDRYMHLSLEAGPSLLDRIVSAGAGLRRMFDSPVGPMNVVPKLEDYPYRG